MGAGLGFAKLAKLKADETVVFSWIVYKSKAHRNQVNKKVMRDPDMNNFDTSTMPFDMRRFATGGFKVLLEG
jgi:alkaline phosphatase